MSAELLLCITRFGHKRDNQPKQGHATWDKTATLLTAHKTREEKDGPLFSPTLYAQGATRANENVVSVSLFVADVDDGAPVEALRDRWVAPDGTQLAFALYSSFSSTLAHPKYRVVFPLAAPVPAGEWNAVWFKLNDALMAGHCDPSRKDLAAMYYLPSCAAASFEEAFTDRQDGAFLDPSLFPAPEPELVARNLSDAARQSGRAVVGNDGDGGNRPGDDYNRRGIEHAIALLEKHGATLQRERGDVAYILRPGKQSRTEWSATFGFVAPGVLYVFTSSWSPFESRTCYSPFSIFALLECGGDFKEAARRLGAMGYGEQTRPQVSAPRRPVPKDATVTAVRENADESGAPSADSAVPSLSTAFKLTDMGNAERFVAVHGAIYRFDHDMKAWYRYDGKRWALDATSQVQESAKQTIRAIYTEASAESEDERRTALVKHAMSSEKAGRIVAMVDLAENDPLIAVRQSVWDADPMAFNCQNGTVDLRTGELRPHSPRDLITNIAPVPYDPKATAPTWEKCLERWQPDTDVRGFLARAAGYSLTGNIGEETAFFTYGLGRNGKSKFTGAIAYVMGDYATRVSIEALMDTRRAGAATPDLVPLVGARLVVASEVHEGKRLNESYIKDLTGGDAITARANYGAVFVFHPSFKLWLYGNHKPDIRGTDDGIWSRLPLIPFTVTIPVEERDPDLSAKLEAEAAGIFAWAVRGCLEWQKMRLAPPEAVLEATAEYRKQQDPTTYFFTDRCVVDGDRDDLFTSAATLYKSYEEWAEGEGEKRFLSTKALGERLARLGLKSETRRIAGKVTRCWIGIGLLPSIPRCLGASCNGCNACNGSLQNSDKTPIQDEFYEEALHPLQPLQNLAFTEEREETETEGDRSEGDDKSAVVRREF